LIILAVYTNHIGFCMYAYLSYKRSILAFLHLVNDGSIPKQPASITVR
jgi:hypothetical protein